MLPRRRESSGYHDVRARPSGAFSAEIQSDEMRLGLGIFDTAHEAARAYNAAAWRLWRPRREMNVPEVATWEQARELAPPHGLSSRGPSRQPKAGAPPRHR
nr:ethylene-responsive transcription factor 5-like [Aegilops tauschii subsp. strangulata]